MEQVIVDTTHGSSRGYSRVSLCKRRFGCRKVISHFHVENYSSASARSPFSQSGPFTCCDNAFKQIEEDLCATAEQQKEAVLKALDDGIISWKEDPVDQILDPDNGFMVAEGLEFITPMEHFPDLTIEPGESLPMDQVNDQASDKSTIVVESREPPLIRRRSQQPAITASGEIGSST